MKKLENITNKVERCPDCFIPMIKVSFPTKEIIVAWRCPKCYEYFELVDDK